ncbi:unnamed protein product, partial [marine sediment metagenome]
VACANVAQRAEALLGVSCSLDSDNRKHMKKDMCNLCCAHRRKLRQPDVSCGDNIVDNPRTALVAQIAAETWSKMRK